MQQVLVAIIVSSALLVSVWKLMPARRRLQLLVVLDGWAAGHPALSGWRERSLKSRMTRAAGVGCEGCASNTGKWPHPPR